MHRAGLLLVAIVTGLGFVPPAKSTMARSRQACFWPSQVTGFSDAGPDRALVRLGFRETWELTLAHGCPDVNFAQKIGIRSRGGERICSGRPAELLVPDESETNVRRCLVRSVRRLSPAEAAAARGEKP